jgi:hypothetical protein
MSRRIEVDRTKTNQHVSACHCDHTIGRNVIHILLCCHGRSLFSVRWRSNLVDSRYADRIDSSDRHVSEPSVVVLSDALPCSRIERVPGMKKNWHWWGKP